MDKKSLHVRLAQYDDVTLLWQWSNDPITRANSFHHEPIPLSTHTSWFRKKLASEDTRIWILEYRHIPIGQIRYDRIDTDTAEISYLVQHDHRGRGFGTEILQSTGDLASRELSVRRLQGSVFVSNIASARSFIKAGYKQIAQKPIESVDCYVFCREYK